MKLLRRSIPLNHLSSSHTFSYFDTDKPSAFSFTPPEPFLALDSLNINSHNHLSTKQQKNSTHHQNSHNHHDPRPTHMVASAHSTRKTKPKGLRRATHSLLHNRLDDLHRIHKKTSHIQSSIRSMMQSMDSFSRDPQPWLAQSIHIINLVRLLDLPMYHRTPWIRLLRPDKLVVDLPSAPAQNRQSTHHLGLPAPC